MPRARKKKKNTAAPFFDPKTSGLMYAILMLLLSLVLGAAVTGLLRP